MKLKSLALFVGACCGLAMPAVSNAAESFGFHGYIRAGSMFDAKDNFAKAGYEYEMDKTMGRLGSELDNSWEAGLNKLWDLGSNKSVNIHFKVESDADGLQTRAAPRESGVSETYVELGGITPTGTMWGGLRYYDRENYIWTTDYFYTDYSGTGVGIKAMEMAGGKWDFAYINSNDTSHSDRANGTEATMHTLHTSALYGAWDMEIALKQMPSNEFTGDNKQYATKGQKEPSSIPATTSSSCRAASPSSSPRQDVGWVQGTCWVPT